MTTGNFFGKLTSSTQQITTGGPVIMSGSNLDFPESCGLVTIELQIITPVYTTLSQSWVQDCLLPEIISLLAAPVRLKHCNSRFYGDPAELPYWVWTANLAGTDPNTGLETTFQFWMSGAHTSDGLKSFLYWPRTWLLRDVQSQIVLDLRP